MLQELTTFSNVSKGINHALENKTTNEFWAWLKVSSKFEEMFCFQWYQSRTGEQIAIEKV